MMMLTAGNAQIRNKSGRPVRFEPCDSKEEAESIARLAILSGVAAIKVATPETDGTWGLYMEIK